MDARPDKVVLLLYGMGFLGFLVYGLLVDRSTLIATILHWGTMGIAVLGSYWAREEER